jgi:glycosyltransferase involved in cell wall biosynthesis
MAAMADSAPPLTSPDAARAPAANAREDAEEVYAPGVSVLICTYNRLPFLKKLAESITPQLPARYPLEIVIVDNNSSDGTADWAKTLAAGNGAFRYLFEPRQGLSHARNAGAAAATHEFLLYLDDDALLPPHFLPTLGRLLARHDPDFLGGPLYPLYLDPKPAWFPESLEVRRKVERSGFDQDVTLTGANYGVKKSVLEKVGGFDPRYGMTGGKVGMLEERLVIETYRRITPPQDQKIYYSLETFILNSTPARRMRVRFQLERIFVGNAQYVRWCLAQGVRSPRLLFQRVWRAFWGELVSWLKAAPGLWHARLSDPERPMLALVKLTYRGADLWGALEFFLTDFGRTRRRRLAETPEARPLRATLFTAASAKAPDIGDLKAALEGEAVIDVVPIGESSDDQIRRLAGQVNLRAQDLIITDSLKAARALAVLRGPRPHLQLLLWLKDPKPLNYLKTARHFLEKRKEAMGRLGRDRALVREVDQVVCGAAWLTGPLARTLLPLPRAVVVPPLRAAGKGEAEQPLRRESVEAWRRILAEARLFAPRRFSP